MLIDDSELKLREKVCAEFRVKMSDVFKRGKPSELRRKIEKRMQELRSIKPVSAFDEYKELVSQNPVPVKRGRGRPRKNPLPPISEPPSVADRMSWIDSPIPQEPSKLNKKLSRVLPKKVETVVDPDNPPIPDDAKFITYKEARESDPPRAPASKKIVEETDDEKAYASYKYANPNPKPLHDIDMSKVKFNPKTDVPKFLRAK